MLSEEEKKAIDNLFNLQHINTYLDLSKESFRIENKTIIKWKESTDIVLNLITKLQKENEELKLDNLEKERILEVFDNRKYRKKYLEERRKEEPNLLYPDGDEIYKRYYEQKKQIDLITNYLAEQDLGHYIKEDGGEIMGLFRCYNKDDWKQHFEEQAKKEGE
jgi:hypothetical protein|nr:MAG TPA: hypothetical protein [Caudoviricetes sp.]